MRSNFLDKFNARFPALRVEFVMSDKFLNLSKGKPTSQFECHLLTKAPLWNRKIADQPVPTQCTHGYVERRGRISCFEDINNHSVIAFDGSMRNHHAARWLRSVAPKARIAARR